MEYKYRYRLEIQKMMFVSGSTSDPPLHTIIVVEEIVRAQVVQLINRGTALARQRGARYISVEDIMFLIRHDVAKVNRLSTYLTWKDVRKNARDQDSGAPGTADGNDIVDDPSASLADKKSAKPRRMGLPWKAQNMFPIPMSSSVVPRGSSGDQQADPDAGDDTMEVGEADVDGEADGDNFDESDIEDSEAQQIMSERLRNADLRTQNMTRDEYVHWSECRQASFTFRKVKRFREWCGLSAITDSRLQDDIMDVLGFLTFEIVANLTAEALKIKEKWESGTKRTTKNRPQTGTLFKLPSMDETPLLPAHIAAAYQQFEKPSTKQRALKKCGGRMRYNVKMI